MCLVLLQLGARIDVGDEHGLTPVFQAASLGHIECLRLLLHTAQKRGKIM